MELINDPEKMKDWQPSLKSYEFVSGEPGKVGAKMKLVHQHGKKPMEMMETILEAEDYYFKALYETKGVENIMVAKFTKENENTTQWETEQQFKFSSLFMKIIGFVFKGAFPRQTEKIMQQFKDYAEST
jgi:hypothetical protein